MRSAFIQVTSVNRNLRLQTALHTPQCDVKEKRDILTMEISFRNSSCALVNLLFASLVCKVQPIKRKEEGKAAKSACLKAKYKNLSISIVKFTKTNILSWKYLS